MKIIKFKFLKKIIKFYLKFEKFGLLLQTQTLQKNKNF